METFLTQNIWVPAVLVLWVLPWKGYALWTSAKLSHKWWFIILLILNTLARTPFMALRFARSD